jgi:hypothetical protein
MVFNDTIMSATMLSASARRSQLQAMVANAPGAMAGDRTSRRFRASPLFGLQMALALFRSIDEIEPSVLF